MKKVRIEAFESVLVHANMIREAEYAFSWQRSIAEFSVYVWPASGNHTVWRDIMLLALSFGDYSHPELVELNDGTQQLVIEVTP